MGAVCRPGLVARSGSELSVKVRLGEPELVEEAAHRSLGMRVIKAGRVALTSTSDLTPRGLDRFVQDALELVEISQEDPFAGPADPALLAKGARSLVLSLWKVDDDATSLLMTRFYQNLLGKRAGLTSPLPKAEALAGICEEAGCADWTTFCLRYAASVPNLKTTIGGTGNLSHLSHFLIAAKNATPLPADVMKAIDGVRA